MNLIIHHFKKECRYLWPRWLVFLAALAVDYAIQMEWLWPIRTQTDESFFTFMSSAVWSFHVWLAAWWLILSVPKEDARGGALDTRPLPVNSYWSARILVWLVLVILPLMIQNGLVLCAFSRPWSEVAIGMLDRGMVAGAMILWVLPAATLYRSWERYVAILLFVMTTQAWSLLFTEWLSRTSGLTLRHSWTILFDTGLTVSAAWILGPLVLLLALWHHRHPLPRWLRLIMPILYGGAVVLVARLPGLPSAHEKAGDIELVKGLADHVPVLSQKDFAITGSRHAGHFAIEGKITIPDLPEGIVTTYQTKRATIHQGTSVILDSPSREPAQWIHPAVWTQLLFREMPLSTLSGAMAPTTLRVGSAQGGRTELCSIAAGTDTKKPLSLDLEMEVHFARVRVIGKTKMRTGERIFTPEAELEIIKIVIGEDPRGFKMPGIVTMTIREQVSKGAARGLFGFPNENILLYSPGRNLLWQQSMSGSQFQRGANHGWLTTEKTFSYLYPVLNEGTGVTTANLAEQELHWITSDYLGTTSHRMTVKDLRLDDLQGSDDNWPSSGDVLSRQGQRPSFDHYIRGLPAPGDDLKSCKRYLAATCNGALAYPHRNGEDDAAATLVTPVLLKHPELIATLGDGIRVHAPKWTRALLRASLRLAKAPETPLPLDVGDWERTSTAVMDALRGDNARLLQLGKVDPERDWQMLPQRITRSRLALLMKIPEYRERTKTEVTRQYERLPWQTSLSEDRARILAAKAALGDADALSRALRCFAVWTTTDDYFKDTVAAFRVIAFDVKREPERSIEFIKNCRKWTTEDFIYNPQALKWTLK